MIVVSGYSIAVVRTFIPLEIGGMSYSGIMHASGALDPSSILGIPTK